MTTKPRIIFLDLLRIFAVIMMVQGHTFDALLSESYRTENSFLFQLWHSLRGFTAPVFIFTAGAVFAYLLFEKDGSLNIARLKKGIKRSFLLIGIGYFLRYPTYKIFLFSNVSEKQWITFFTVDALHLIGLGILAISLTAFLISKFHFPAKIVFAFLGFIIFIFSPIVNSLDWTNFLPLPLAFYFTDNYGSLFPLFPWLGYIFIGAFFGCQLVSKNDSYKNKLLPFEFPAITLILFVFYFLINNEVLPISFTQEYSLILIRLSFIFLLITFFSFISRKFVALPKSLKLVTKNSLFIYILHLIVVYGWVFSPGLSKYFSRSLSFAATLIIFLTIFTIIFALIYGIDKYKKYNQKQILTAEV